MLGRDIYWTLHTSDPGVSGAVDHEASFEGYERVPLRRDTGNFAVEGDAEEDFFTLKTVTPVVFGKCTGNPGPPITHFGVAVKAEGGPLLYVGPLSFPVRMGLGVSVVLPAAMTISE